jgi:hypothetical protein
VVVVFPVPPFWLMIATMWDMVDTQASCPRQFWVIVVMIKYGRKPVKDYLAGVAGTIFAPTFSLNGTIPAGIL